MSYYLGIDGGGTKTTALVCDETGNILCRAESGSLNFYDVGFDGARKTLATIKEQIKTCLGDIAFSSVVIGCSALDDEAPADVSERLCGGIIDTEKLLVNSDLFIALHASGDLSPRIVAVCGTGSMAVGTVDNEKIITSGGWGHIAGDGGSAYSISLTALKTACRLYDKGEYSHPLIETVCGFYGVEDLRQAIDSIYSPKARKSDLAELTPLISHLAEEGCETAIEIIKNQCTELVDTVSALVERMSQCDTVYLYGGVFKNNKLFRDCFVKSFESLYPVICIKNLETSAEQGALNIARSL